MNPAARYPSIKETEVWLNCIQIESKAIGATREDLRLASTAPRRPSSFLTTTTLILRPFCRSTLRPEPSGPTCMVAWMVRAPSPIQRYRLTDAGKALRACLRQGGDSPS